MRILVISIITFAFFLQSNAQTVSPIVAQTLANNVYSERLLLAGENEQFVFNTVPHVVYNQNKPTLFVFIRTDSPGYMIVAADYSVSPVFGYSFESSWWDAMETPVFQDMLNEFSSQVVFARENSLKATFDISAEWDYYTSSSFTKTGKNLKSLSPILSTTWNQGCYYNDLCPEDSQGPCGRVYAGCVATAMGQVMKYHDWPPQGEGSNVYSTPMGYGTLNADFGASTYNWALMQNALNSTTDNYEVAHLLLHCGISVNMNYSWDGSGASTQNSADAFRYNFLYADYVSHMVKDGFSNENWAELLQVELHSERPVLYRGYGSGGGHAFVCDGYQGTNFHFNLGWGGAANGYYSLSHVAGFSTDQAAIFSAEPRHEGPQFCETYTLLTEPEGSFSDNSGSNRYAPGTQCKWLIQPDNAGAIVLNITSLKTEPDVDRILVFEGDSESGFLLADISGFDIPQNPIVASGGSMLVWFFSDSYNCAPGWTAEYTTWFASVDEFEDSYIQIIPNPANDVINIHLNPSINGNITIYINDLTGKRVLTFNEEAQNGQCVIDISALSSGIYPIEIYQNNSFVTISKLVKE